MTLYVRVYATEKKARDAADKLKAEGLGEDKVCVIAPAPDADAGAVVAAAVKDGRLPQNAAAPATADLKKGRCVVAVDAGYGAGQKVSDILAKSGPVGTLYASPAGGAGGLTTEGMGFPLLKDGPSPLAGVFGGQLTSSKYYAFGEPNLTNDPAPLSTKIGMTVLSEPKKDWTQSFGQPLLAAKRFIFGEPQLTSKYTAGEPQLTSNKYSFGDPKLTSDAAPFSKKIGMSVLSDD